MKSGIELITQERLEQITKHGWTLEHDKDINGSKELVQAANYCLMLAGFKEGNYFWPSNWQRDFEHKILNKDKVGKLVVAGAFLMAENDRRQDKFHEETILEIAAKIDRLLNNSNHEQ